MQAVTFCPNCLARISLRVAQATGVPYTCARCAAPWYCQKLIWCPHPRCGRQFPFDGRDWCPYCANHLADSVPLQPLPSHQHLLESLIPKRRHAREERIRKNETLFVALYHSWVNECLGRTAPRDDPGYQIEEPIIKRHYQLLER